mgnify:CR=1 FL=1
MAPSLARPPILAAPQRDGISIIAYIGAAQPVSSTGRRAGIQIRIHSKWRLRRLASGCAAPAATTAATPATTGAATAGDSRRPRDAAAAAA